MVDVFLQELCMEMAALSGLFRKDTSAGMR